jgi:hypothetical protein
MSSYLTCSDCAGSSFAICKLCTTATCLSHLTQWSSKSACKHTAVFVSQLHEAEAAECTRLFEASVVKRSLSSNLQTWLAKLNEDVDVYLGAFAELVADLIEEFKSSKTRELRSFISALTPEDCSLGLEVIEAQIPAVSYDQLESYLASSLIRKSASSQISSTQDSPSGVSDRDEPKSTTLFVAPVHDADVFGILRDDYDLTNFSWDSEGSCFKWSSKTLDQASKFSIGGVSAATWLNDNSRLALGTLAGDVIIADRSGSHSYIGLQKCGGITHIAPNSKISQMISVNKGHRIALWCLERCKFQRLLPELAVNQFCVSSNYLALSHNDKVSVKDLSSYDNVFSLECSSQANSLAISADETSLLVGCKHGVLKMFDLRTRTQLQQAMLHERTPIAIKPTESFSTIACVFSDLALQVVETSQLQAVKYWRSETSASAVEWLGDKLIVGTEEGSIRICT